LLLRVLWLLLIVVAITAPVQAAESVVPEITVGTQEVGLSAGYLLPHRLTIDHTTKQQGVAMMPSWMMTVTDPMGDSWYRGQISLGAEVVYIQFQEPFLTHGMGSTAFAPMPNLPAARSGPTSPEKSPKNPHGSISF